MITKEEYEDAKRITEQAYKAKETVKEYKKQCAKEKIDAISDIIEKEFPNSTIEGECCFLKSKDGCGLDAHVRYTIAYI